MRWTPLPLLLMSLASPALASDGVLEINQTCAVETGCFGGDGRLLPVTITEAGSYRLTSNLVVTDVDTDAIVVEADGVSIDLAGFEIRGPVVCSGDPLTCSSGSGSGSGVRASGSASGTSVRNGTVRGMGRYGLDLGESSEVRQVAARSNRLQGIEVGDGSTVSDSRADRNGSNGIRADSGCTVSGNVSSHNVGTGIVSSSGTTVSGNAALENGGNGINGGSVISGNSSRRNGGVGIRGAASNISGNSAISNDNDGINCSVGRCLVRNNTSEANGGYGIDFGVTNFANAYGANLISNNAEGTVRGGSNILLNVCDGANAPQCP